MATMPVVATNALNPQTQKDVTGRTGGVSPAGTPPSIERSRMIVPAAVSRRIAVSHIPLRGSHPIPPSERRSESSDADAGSLRTTRSPAMSARPGANHGRSSVRTNRSAFTGSAATLPRARIRSGIHGAFVGMTKCTTVPCPSKSPSRAALPRLNVARAKTAPLEL